MSNRAYYRSVTTAVLRRMYSKLRDGLLSLAPEDRPLDDMESLREMREEIDRRSGLPPVNVEFSDYVSD